MKGVYILLSCQLSMLLALPPSASGGSENKEVWTVECEESPKSDLLPIRPPKPLNNSLVFILLMSRTAVRICDELNNTVIVELNKTKQDFNEHQTSQLETLLTGPASPGEGHTREVDTVITMEIERLSRIGLFLELARNDTAEYDAKITELENKVGEILCEMFNVMADRKVKVTSQVTHDLIAQEFVHLDNFAKHQRNFFITRASRHILYHLIGQLKSLTSTNMGPL